MSNVPLNVELPGLKLLARGKVREVFAVDEQHLLFVASDRISAFDVVMKTPIPGKGKLLTQLSLFWFDLLKDVCPNHLVTANIDEMPASVQAHRAVLEGRVMLVRRLKILPVEAIVRGYLMGSGLKEYKALGTVCGIQLPTGLLEASALPQTLYTPSTKAAEGAHDLNISPEEAARILGPHAAAVESTAIRFYERARDHAASRGIIIADTKFEFGVDRDGKLILADEVLTPDSSRFWPKGAWHPGRPQDSFDKQYLRDYLEAVRFNKNGPGIELPESVVTRTMEKYVEAYRLLTGREPVL
jgi:phosphoribosylaminoimidazole-succinocarboxamide synthase